MDKIKVTTDTLIAADNALKELNNCVLATITRCESDIKNEFNGVDAVLQKDLLEYLGELESFKRNIMAFQTENSQAIRQRITKISEYSSTSYKPRNIK